MTFPAELAIMVRDPVWRSTRTLVERIESAENYGHEIRAQGGYWSAGLTRRADVPYVDRWIVDGLGRDVEVVGADLTTVWRGFVNRIEAVKGRLTTTVGPLLNVGNRAHLVYSTTDATCDPPAVGIRRRTDVYNDLTSQARWGILYKVLSSGGSTPDNAATLVQSWLAEYSEPDESGIWGDSAGAPSVMLECLGYYHLMKWPYNQTAATGTGNLSTKLQNIISADPNGIFSTNFTKIATNTLAVPVWENDDRTARELIEKLTLQGDASYTRYLFGIYDNLRAEYRAATDQVKYTQRLADPDGEIRLSPDAPIAQWAVRPGYWLKYSDHLVEKPDAVPGSDSKNTP